MNNSLNGFIIFKCQRAQTLLSVYVIVLIANEKHLLNAEYKLDFYIFWYLHAKLAATILGYSAWHSDIYIHLIFNVRAAMAIFSHFCFWCQLDFVADSYHLNVLS